MVSNLHDDAFAILKHDSIVVQDSDINTHIPPDCTIDQFVEISQKQLEKSNAEIIDIRSTKDVSYDIGRNIGVKEPKEGNIRGIDRTKNEKRKRPSSTNEKKVENNRIRYSALPY